MVISDAKRLRALEEENRRLKQLVADLPWRSPDGRPVRRSNNPKRAVLRWRIEQRLSR
jgi:hypothetical protein